MRRPSMWPALPTGQRSFFDGCVEIRKEVSILGKDSELCTHFYDYTTNKYSFMLNDGHSFQSLIMSNGINFDENNR